MIGLLQRVSRASVSVQGETIAAIERGLCVFLCAEPGDDERSCERLLERLIGYRVFADGRGRMNLSAAQLGAALLLVPQFTLAADTSSGSRPGFSTAAPPELASRLFEHAVRYAAARHGPVASGRFGAHMTVELVNEGPVTLWLRTAPG
ncbi:MAG: D-tyrosyl-tRNA(Tyr) deacylase [Burkholderiales bacterium]|nr:D-tyrosyl-tRNA(Tyr) deacylase [Burkholderiales bacterium]